jgi:CobQ-like glutamine amidotransferase family enzyme
MSSWFTIARVLPSHFSLNGSAANAEIVAVALQRLGHHVALLDVNTPSDVVSTVDLACIGSGSGSSIRPAAIELIGLASALNQWKSNGAWYFGVGTGWDLLGETLTLSDGTKMPGAGIFPSVADHRVPRFSGEIAGVDYQGRPSAGYVNQVGQTELSDGVSHLLSVNKAAGDYPAEEGLVGPLMMATRLGGPALALNPHWLDDIVAGILLARGLEYTPGAFRTRVNHAAQQARHAIETRLATRG